MYLKYTTRQLIALFTMILLFTTASTSANQGNTRNKSSNAYHNNYKRLTAGNAASFEIRGGKLYAWGANLFGQLGIGNNVDQWTPVQVGVATNWVSIASGNNQTIALKSDGTLWTCGLNSFGQLGIGNTVDQNSFVQVGTDNKWVSITTGTNFCAAIKSDGTLWTWGQNAEGQLGIGNTTNQSTPVQVGTSTDWVALRAGVSFVMAIKSNGTLWAWGRNVSGQLGIGNNTQQNSPVQVGVDNDWVSVTAGTDFCAVLKSNGTIWTSGANGSGQLGIGTLTPQNTLGQVGTSTDWVAISSGALHTHALKANGTLWSWGSGSGGRLGTGNTGNQLSPVQVGTSHNWTDVSAGSVYGIGIQAGGRVFAWGGNGNGQLGIGNTIQQLNPVPTSTPAIEWINISTGGNHTVGVRSEGSLWVWGFNGSGQLGTGNTTDIHFPYQLDADTTWVGVAAGDVHTLAMKANGTLWAWGGNTTGQLGNGNNTDQHSPVQIGTDTNWVSISAGRGHSVALKSNGTIWTWGINTYGQLGNGNNTNSNTPTQLGTAHDWICVMAGGDHTLALKANGTLWAWGYNTYGQLGNGTNTHSNVPVQVGVATDWTLISGGGYHSIALKSNGTMYAWGYNLYGQLGIGNNTNQNTPQQIGAGNTWIGATTGEEHSFAFKTDGTGNSWGYNLYGQLGLNNNTNFNVPQAIPSQSGIVQLFCGAQGMHSTLIKDARDLVCLAGRNTYGQLGNNTTLNANNYNCITICNPVTPTVTESVSPNDTLCMSQSVTFTVTQTNGGPNPVYQWYKNGFPVGINAPTYTDNAPANNDQISITMTSNATCALPLQVSDTIKMVVNSPSNLLAGSVGNTESMTVSISGPTDVRYYADCDLIATITPSGANPVSGSTIAKVKIDNTTNYYNSQPYVRRHFDIEPATLPASATATIRLYAYQSEFDTYNAVAVPGGWPPLPTAAVDNGFVRISQFHGTGTAPGNYTGSEELITPTVSWDPTHSWWVMEFPVTGFSGFYIHTAWGHPLDISIKDISAANEGSGNRIDWTSSTERGGDSYTLQHSTDGAAFSDLATIKAKGEAGPYSYYHARPYTGVNYYRVRLNDAAGYTAYTKVVSVDNSDATMPHVSVHPNPVKDVLQINYSGMATGELRISEMTGRVMIKQALGNSVDVKTLPKGTYLLEINDAATGFRITNMITKE